MNTIEVFKSILHALLALLMFLVPFYVDRLEKNLSQRLFPDSRLVQETSLRVYIGKTQDFIRKSVIGTTIALEVLLAFAVALFPTNITECIGILILITYALYRKYENTRKCPSCYSLIHDHVTTCPECGNTIGSRWGMVRRVINSNWLTANSRFFRYKCS